VIARLPSLRALALLFLLSLLSGCVPFTLPDQQQDQDTLLRSVITAQGLTGDPSVGRELPEIDDPLAQLGKALFYTTALSGNMDTACATCHHPLLGGGDGLTLSVGVEALDPTLLGPGRSHSSGAPNVARNAPTTFNIGLWDAVQFHDGRVESLDKLPRQGGAGPRGIHTPDAPPGMADPQAGADLVAAQSRFPLTAVTEMRGTTVAAYRPNRTLRAYLCARLGDYGPAAGELPGSGWPAEFAAVFGPATSPQSLITDARIAAALSAFQRSQLFVDTPWRAYVQGDSTALSPAAKSGALLFLQTPEQGGAGCVLCHRGDFFTDEQFHALAVPQVGIGKQDDPYYQRADVQAEDFGRWYATFAEQDRYRFRTPTLLNVAVTAPYGHDGAYATLEGIVRHHLDPAAALASYNPAQLDAGVASQLTAAYGAKALAKLEQDRRSGALLLPTAALSDSQIDDLLAFLAALTDSCVQDAACLAPWLPDPATPDPDGLRLAAQFTAAEDTP